MEKITKIVELDIDDPRFDEELFEDYGVNIISLVDRPAIGVDFMSFNEEFVKPNSGENKDEFLQRCMSELNTEFPDQDQRYAVCNTYWDEFKQEEFESYDDYPNAARENACRAIIYTDENGWGDCGTQVGKRRASQLCMGQKISRDTIARMASFERHRQHKDVPYDEGCGGLMWDAWGGDEGIAWAQRKLEQIEEMSGEELIFSEEAQAALIDFAENNGEYIGEDDLILDLNKSEFSTIGNVITAIRSLDILKRLIIKKNEKPETYWRYTGPRPQRNFCKAMINLTNAGKIFTQAEIEKMDGLNAQFARRGSSSYSIFKFKGGKNCKHYWQKLDVFKNEFGQRVIIVGQPANATQETASKTWNQLSEEVYNFSIDDEKKIVLGPVMIPNKMILRRDEEGNPFYVYFKKDTIKKMSEKFLAKNLLHNTDVNHDNNVTQENTLLESWISESILHDKAYKYGFNLPVGTWYVSYKINNEDIWNDIKERRLKGFSLAGGFITRLNDTNTLNQIKNILKNINE